MKKVRILVLMALVFGISVSAQALTIFGDSFDDNTAMAGWKRSSTSYVSRVTSGYKVGDASMRINGKYEAITYINTKPFKNLKLTFKMAASSLLTGQTMQAYVDYGAGWKLIASKANGALTSYSYTFPTTATTVKIRFYLNTTATGKYGYVDDVILTGDR